MSVNISALKYDSIQVVQISGQHSWLHSVCVMCNMKQSISEKPKYIHWIQQMSQIWKKNNPLFKIKPFCHQVKCEKLVDGHCAP